MGDRSLDELGSLQRRVMECIWELGEAKVADVLKHLGRRPRPAYTTVLSVMQKLDQRGWLTHRAEGRSYVYRAVHSRREVGRQSIRSYIERVFDGDPLLLFEHLIEDETIGPDELAGLRRLIDAQRRRRDRDA